MMTPGRHTCRLFCLILPLAVMMIVAVMVTEPAARVSAQVAGPVSTLTGSLNTARAFHTATRLLNGKVLVAGGYRDIDPVRTLTGSAELYDPATGTWSETSSLNTPRYENSATMLSDGKVLVAGGSVGSNPAEDAQLISAELYDPVTGAWSSTGSLNRTRAGHRAVLLPNGKILVAGGYAERANLNSAETYDPITGKWSETSSLNTLHGVYTASLLPDGKVIATGWTDDVGPLSAEVYDPLTGTWSNTGNLNTVRFAYSATLLPNGQLLVVGGNNAELYDPVTGTWTVTGNLNLNPNNEGSYTTTLLSNGKVLVAGFFDYDVGYFQETRLYDPATGIWSNAGTLIRGRTDHTATLLPNGRVLIAGGLNYEFTLKMAELFDSGLPQTGTIESVSAASFNANGVGSEAITASFGSGLATVTSSAASLPLPTSLAGTSVSIKDSAGIEGLAPLFFVSPTQVNYLIPPGTAAGMATVAITSGDGTVSTGVVQISRVAPSLFSANADGHGVAAALALRVRADGSQSYEPIAQFDAAQNKFVARPLDLGTAGEEVFLLLFGTGIRHRSLLTSVIAAVGGEYAEVSFAGAQGDFVGLDQVNVRLPRNLAGRGEIEVLLTVEAEMANPVRIEIK